MSRPLNLSGTALRVLATAGLIAPLAAPLAQACTTMALGPASERVVAYS
jgi:hypothetical protein